MICKRQRKLSARKSLSKQSKSYLLSVKFISQPQDAKTLKPIATGSILVNFGRTLKCALWLSPSLSLSPLLRLTFGEAQRVLLTSKLRMKARQPSLSLKMVRSWELRADRLAATPTGLGETGDRFGD